MVFKLLIDISVSGCEKHKDWFMDLLQLSGSFTENIAKKIVYQHRGILAYL